LTTLNILLFFKV